MNIIKSLNKDCYIDITSLENIDSNGRNALLFAQRNLEVSGNKLYILSTGANPLNRVLQVAPSLQEARA